VRVCPANHGLDRNELLLRKAQRFSDLARLAIIIANYTSKSYFSHHILHLKGEDVFRFVKRPTNCPLGVDNDFHHLDCVNCFHPQLTIIVVQPNFVNNVSMQQSPCCSNACLPLVSQCGLELKESICVDG
jgi:hypothetical protein